MEIAEVKEHLEELLLFGVPQVRLLNVNCFSVCGQVDVQLHIFALLDFFGVDGLLLEEEHVGDVVRKPKQFCNDGRAASHEFHRRLVTV